MNVTANSTVSPEQTTLPLAPILDVLSLGLVGIADALLAARVELRGSR